MPSVAHVVTTGNFAGVERYVCNAATELAARSWDVTVVGGHPERMPLALGEGIRWLPGATCAKALRSLARLAEQDLCHAHMTIAEALAVAAQPFHRAPIVSTRHFAARRGSSRGGRVAAPLISARLARQIAVSDFVAHNMERNPDAVISNGVPSSPRRWNQSNRIVLVLQRLEREKDTLTALRAWQAARLFDEGWSLRVVGEGAERRTLEAWVSSEHVPGITFAGWTSDVASELAGAGILLAPAPSDSLGIGVLEAMAAGVPVVASAAGGHLETVGRLNDAPLFAPGDAEASAEALSSLLPDEKRAALSAAGRQLVSREFTIERHVDRLLPEYEAALAKTRSRRGAGLARPAGDLRELVVCSLEAWDDVWRRNQFFTDVLMRRNPDLRVLFVEPPADPLFDLSSRRAPTLPRLRAVTADGRLRAFRPLKVLPRRAGPIADLLLRAQALLAARLMGFTRPALWINDVTYAPMIAGTGWPSVYDVTDDWLLAPFPPREVERLGRLDELAVRTADEVVVCSQALAESRGPRRSVSIIPNGVDVEHFRRSRPRPEDLPPSPVAVYVGSLHDSRIDVELLVDVARALPQLSIALIGPNSLESRSLRLFDALPNVILLGSRPYENVPAYLQHAEVFIVPHRISPFTESLDPIKAYECLAVGVPTVATPVAGFRDLDGAVTLASRDSFAGAVEATLRSKPAHTLTRKPASWEDRAGEFEGVLVRAHGMPADNRVGHHAVAG